MERLGGRAPWRRVERWCPCLERKRDPYLVGQLSGEFVELKCRNQADHALGNALANLHKGLVLRRLRVGEHVQAPRGLLQHAFIAEASKVLTGNVDLLQILRSQNALRLDKPNDALARRNVRLQAILPWQTRYLPREKQAATDIAAPVRREVAESGGRMPWRGEEAISRRR
jgi:hypothetical protein